MPVPLKRPAGHRTRNLLLYQSFEETSTAWHSLADTFKTWWIVWDLNPCLTKSAMAHTWLCSYGYSPCMWPFLDNPKLIGICLADSLWVPPFSTNGALCHPCWIHILRRRLDTHQQFIASLAHFRRRSLRLSFTLQLNKYHIETHYWNWVWRNQTFFHVSRTRCPFQSG